MVTITPQDTSHITRTDACVIFSLDSLTTQIFQPDFAKTRSGSLEKTSMLSGVRFRALRLLLSEAFGETKEHTIVLTYMAE